MGLKFNPLTSSFDLTGSGGGGSAFFAGEVATYADLPLDGTAALNSRWLVRNSSGTWPFPNYRQGGIYIRTSIVGSSRDNDYTLADTKLPDVFADSAFLLYDNSDSTRNLQFDLGSITTGTTRTLTAPNASGRIQVEGQPIGNTTPAAGTFTTLSAAPTSGSALTLTGGTVTASTPVIDATQTWNNAAVTFTGLRFNATNTASATASPLIDLQVGGVSRMRMTRGGTLHLSEHSNSGLYSPAPVWTGSTAGLLAATNLAIGSNLDTILERGGAGIIEQRNAANAQEYRIFNTFTSATNHERGFLKWSSNVFQIGTEKGSGGGSARALELQTDGVTRLTVQTGGTVALASHLTAESGFIRIASAQAFQWLNRSKIYSLADGNVGLYNAGESSFNLLQFGGTTTSFPALKRSSTVLQARLANDSDFCPLQGQLRTHANAVTETITADKTLTFYDAAGTAYKVPCVAA